MAAACFAVFIIFFIFCISCFSARVLIVPTDLQISRTLFSVKLKKNSGGAYSSSFHHKLSKQYLSGDNFMCSFRWQERHNNTILFGLFVPIHFTGIMWCLLIFPNLPHRAQFPCFILSTLFSVVHSSHQYPAWFQCTPSASRRLQRILRMLRISRGAAHKISGWCSFP